MKHTNQIKNGSLYYNMKEGKVVRALGAVNTLRLWTQYHKETVKDAQVEDLRLATADEVDKYKEETNERFVTNFSPSAFA